MKIERVMLHRVGKYRDEVIGPFMSGMNVVYGLNEAGKSTFLAGFRGLVFGRATLSEETIMVPAGAFGQAWLTSKAGETFNLERALAKKSPPKITAPDGTVKSGAHVLADIFPELAEVEELLFRSVFTFQLSDLREAVKENGLQQRLYGIRGLTQLNPAQIESRLAEQVKLIFTPRKTSKRLLNQCLSDLEGVNADLRKTDDTVADYHRLRDESSQLKVRIENLETELGKLDGTLSYYRVLRTILPFQKEWQTLQYQLADGVELQTYSQTRSIRMKQIHTQYVDLELKQMAVQVSYEEVCRKIGQLNVDENILMVATAISGLQQQLGAVLELVHQLEKADNQVRTIEQDQVLLQSQLAAVWTPSRIGTVDLAASQLEFVSSLAERYTQTHDEAMRVQQALTERKFDADLHAQHLGTDFSTGEEFETRLLMERTVLDSQEQALAREESLLEAYQQLISRWIQWLDTLATSKQSEMNNAAESQQTNRLNAKRAQGMGWLGAGGFLLLALWLYLAERFFPASVSLLCGGVFLVALWFVRSPHVSATRSTYNGNKDTTNLTVIEERVAELDNELKTMEADFLLVHPTLRVQRAIVDLRSELVDQKRQTMREISQWQERQHLLDNWKAANQQVVRAQKRLDQAILDQENVLEIWKQTFSQLVGAEAKDFPYPFSPNGFLQDTNQIIAWRKLAASRTALQKEQIELVERLRQFCLDALEQVGSILDETAQIIFVKLTTDRTEFVDWRVAMDNVASIIKTIYHRLLETQAKARERENYTVVASQLQQQLQGLSTEMESLQAEVHSAFVALSVFDWPSYEQEDGKMQAYAELTSRAADLYRQMLAYLGGAPGKLEKAVVFLADKTTDDIVDLVTDTLEKIETLKQVLQTAIRAQGVLEERIQSFPTIRTSERLNWDKAALESTRNELAWSWGVLMMAKMIARQARVQYEEANQPEVLGLTSSIFCEITDGRYQVVKSRMDESGLPILYGVMRDGSAMEVTNFSRGTKEQLYLAVRLAMIELFRKRGVELPVILDDPMVNFDSERTARYFKILRKYATNQQFIYLTCHRQMIELANSCSDTHVLEL